MWNDIEKAMEDLQKTLSNYKDYQKDYARKEYNYRTALSKRLVTLRVNKIKSSKENIKQKAT